MQRAFSRLDYFKMGAAAMGTVIAVCLFGYTLVHAAFYLPSDETDAGLPAAASAALRMASSTQAGVPARLLIPKLGIDANVQHVGLGKTGNMAVPTNFTDVAWYRGGPEPGEAGSAVMDGHVDNGLGLAGVFKHLSELKVGDDLYVTTEAGAKLHFIVDDVEVYPYTDLPLARIFDTSGTSRLNLITCDGTWVEGQKTYNERLVIYSHVAP